jgi:hypothetical protein
MKKTKLKKQKIRWMDDVELHDYPAAASYLTLIFPEDIVKNIVSGLKGAPIVHFKAKDLFRASRLSLLGVSNSHVAKNLEKIRKKKKMSPLLLVRNTKENSLIIADGYHRMCAAYFFNEDVLVPCKIK